MEKVALVVGEALVDVVVLPDGTTTAYPGGSAANVAVALARLDRPAWFSTCFADDDYGQLIGAQLERAGVRLASDPAAADHTSSAIATIGTDGAASYEFDLAWRLNPLTLDAVARAGRRAHQLAGRRPGARAPTTWSRSSRGCGRAPPSATTSTRARSSPAPGPRSSSASSGWPPSATS